MNQSKQLATRLREVIYTGKWVANTNLNEQLTKINVKKANERVGEAHTIAEITSHICYYISGVLNVFEGGDLEISDTFSFENEAPQTEEDWKRIQKTLVDDSEKMAKHIEQLSNDQLEAVFVDEKYGNYQRNIEGIIEHTYYHFGQIRMLSKFK